MKVQTEQESNRLRYAQEKARQDEKYITMQKQMTDFQNLLASRPDTIHLPRPSGTKDILENREDLNQGVEDLCNRTLWEEVEDLLDDGYGEEDYGQEYGSPPPTTKQIVQSAPKPT